jgi:hypothetical protein
MTKAMNANYTNEVLFNTEENMSFSPRKLNIMKIAEVSQ